MSKPFEPTRDEAWAESELVRACTELDGHIPDGYFDDFSSRLAANLEAQAMETPETMKPTDSGPQAIMPKGTEAPPAADGGVDDRDEHSGLHEIKALASSAREKITRRRTTEHDLEESLLASSSSGLPAVVLPDPERSTPQMEIIEASTPSLTTLEAADMSAAPASASFGAGIEARSTPKPWLWIALAGAAVASAAVAVVVLTGGSADTDSEPSIAMNDQAEAKEDLAPGAPPAAPAATASANAVQPEPVVASLDADDQEEETAKDSATETDVNDGAALGGARAASAPADKAREKRQREEKLARAAEKKERAKGNKGDSDSSEAVETEAEGTPAKAKKAKTGEGQGDINDILDEVTGGKSAAPPPEEDEAKPDKKRIGSSDVRTAMGRITGKVNRCGSKTGFSGKVSVRFSVAASGKVTKASVKTGDAKVKKCVAAAVRSARFPSFNPPAMSFSWSFLISD